MIQCECLSFETDSCELITTREPKARKVHICCECLQPILPGQKYEYVAGVWEGTFFVFKTCLPCSQIRYDHFPCGWIYGQLYKMLKELYSEGGEEVDGDWGWLTG